MSNERVKRLRAKNKALSRTRPEIYVTKEELVYLRRKLAEYRERVK